jgi:hypothetical protein
MVMTQTLHSSQPATHRNWRRFWIHYAEMIAAMFVGMFALGALESLVGLDVDFTARPILGYSVMALNMSIGMIAIMRYRGHGWPATLEMCAVMFVPIAPLYPLYESGLIDAMGVMMVSHIAMFPLMLAVMFRRLDEFTHCH